MIRCLSIITSRHKMKKPILMCFDFDQTINQENTDIVACKLLPKDKFEETKAQYISSITWTEFMRKIFHLLHESGVSKENIVNTINSTPATSGFEELLKNLHSHNCESIIISDANSIFIEGWLKHNNLDHTIMKIFTNPAWFDENGLLNIKEYQYQDWCSLSEKNLCKGYIMEKYIKQRSEEGVEFDRIGYAGDGSNDYCPILKLSDNDLAFPRQNYSIIKCLKNPEHTVNAKVIPWEKGSDIWSVISQNMNLC